MSPADAEVLPALPLPGLRPHALGRYLAALGLLRIAARHWGDVRGAWRDDCFWLVGGPRTMRDLASYLRAPDTPWSCYEHGWKKAQDDEKKRKKGAPSPYLVWLSEQDEETTELALAHLVIGSTRYFNPLTGSGGNAGRRVFSKGWSEAQPPSGPSPTAGLTGLSNGSSSGFSMGPAGRCARRRDGAPRRGSSKQTKPPTAVKHRHGKARSRHGQCSSPARACRFSWERRHAVSARRPDDSARFPSSRHPPRPWSPAKRDVTRRRYGHPYGSAR